MKTSARNGDWLLERLKSANFAAEYLNAASERVHSADEATGWELFGRRGIRQGPAGADQRDLADQAAILGGDRLVNLHRLAALIAGLAFHDDHSAIRARP